ncbi:hypothetical protein PR048_023568 [Dryococelus australis]|uniref:HAT C-terminal dimerisation domain-containing protein n=1 Tax=Dryococelus australis TaxID=614101 RepID=A0ABQ9GUG0_9NEOP|nr:hypothetical protein PR048_023568 [Dryococelus australis]
MVSLGTYSEFSYSFYLATLNISNENVTVAEVIPTVNGLKSELTTLTEQQHSGLKGVQRDMIHSLCCHFRSIETNNVFAIATLLDPRDAFNLLISAYRCPEAEVEMYIAEPPIPINSNPIQYWKTSPYTRLRKAAQKYLSSPDGSVASERLFSFRLDIFQEKEFLKP